MKDKCIEDVAYVLFKYFTLGVKFSEIVNIVSDKNEIIDRLIDRITKGNTDCYSCEQDECIKGDNIICRDHIAQIKG